MKCPECNNKIKCESIISPFESYSGYCERLYSCEKCGFAWITKEVDGKETEPKRYYFV